MKKCCSLKLDRCIYRGLMAWFSTAARQKLYLSRIMKFRLLDLFSHISKCICAEFFFLITLYIYKDYFKGRIKTDATWCKVILLAYYDQRQFAIVHLFVEATAFVHQEASWSSLLDELKNLVANIFLKLVCKSRTGIRSSIG